MSKLPYVVIDAERLAMLELAEERKREEIDAAKDRLRAKEKARRWWHVLVPFTVKIERRA